MKSHTELPNEYFCPITLEIMKNPVIAMDGHSYEKNAIERWLQNNNRSPKTNAILEDKTLVPNHTLRGVIEESMARGILCETKVPATTHVRRETYRNRTTPKKEEKLHQKDFQMAAILQWNETDGLAVGSRLRISELEYDLEQLVDWCGLNDQKNKELALQLEQALLKEKKLRQQMLQSSHSQQEIHGYEKDLCQINEKLADDPSNGRFINIKATTLRKLQRTQEALAILSLAIRKKPSNVYLLHTRGVIYADMGQLTLAKRDFKRILSVEPENSYGIHGLQLVENKLNQLEKMQSLPQECLQREKTRKLMQESPQAKKMPHSMQELSQDDIRRPSFWTQPSSQTKRSVQVLGEQKKSLRPSHPNAKNLERKNQ